MSPRSIPDIQLVNTRGRKYLTAEEPSRFLAAAAREPDPENQTFALVLAHTEARDLVSRMWSEPLA